MINVKNVVVVEIEYQIGSFALISSGDNKITIRPVLRLFLLAILFFYEIVTNQFASDAHNIMNYHLSLFLWNAILL